MAIFLKARSYCSLTKHINNSLIIQPHYPCWSSDKIYNMSTVTNYNINESIVYVLAVT